MSPQPNYCLEMQPPGPAEPLKSSVINPPSLGNLDIERNAIAMVDRAADGAPAGQSGGTSLSTAIQTMGERRASPLQKAFDRNS